MNDARETANQRHGRKASQNSQPTLTTCGTMVDQTALPKTSGASRHLDNDAPRDEEGLLLEYDAIICGTGLTQSILASALARHGKSVLHCDTSDYYGELDAVWTLPYLQEKLGKGHELKGKMVTVRTDDSTCMPLSPKGGLQSFQIHSLKRRNDFTVEQGTAVVTPYGNGTIISISPRGLFLDLLVSLDTWKLANGKNPSVHISIPQSAASTGAAFQKYLKEKLGIVSIDERDAHLVLDERSRGFAVDATPGLLYASGASVGGLLKSGVADYLEFKSLEGLLWLENSDSCLEPVPCSKNDVFASKLLSPMDKRRLMKFLQLALDYGTAHALAEEEASAENNKQVLSLNERYLNQGRSLARPQNKAVLADDIRALQEFIQADMKFHEYLESKQRLSPKLCRIVRHALALESGNGDWSLRQGMTSLCQHMQALGRFGTTAFLVPMYGSGELPQAFCRSAAVYGATYLLRRAPLAIVTDKERKTVKAAVIATDGEASAAMVKEVMCRHMVVPQDSVATLESKSRRVWRYLCIFRGKVVGSSRSPQRHAIIVPPGAFGPDAVRGVLLDEGVNVTPHVPCGCTILHLTMAVENDTGIDPQDILRRVSLSVLSSKYEGSNAIRIFQVTFSYALPEASNQTKNVQNLHCVQRSEPGLSADSSFEQAREIFAAICPDGNFLAISEQVDTVVKERLGEQIEEDADGLVLDSAMDIIEPKTRENSAT
jgi:RAB protein geranylgeranyltransferase component A